MKRRTLLCAGAASLLLAGRARSQTPEQPLLLGADHPLQAAWAAYKAAFLLPSGRIVDGPQQGASHSEGQGYGATLAVTFGDRAAFDRIVSWTETNLARRPDGLLAWRWLPDVAVAVPDRNNASDGDLFYAWALIRAREAFDTDKHQARAKELADALALTCVAPHPDGSARLVFVPAVEGFNSEAGVVLNPSYYMPRAMRELADATGQARLAQCAQDGVDWINEISQTGPVPDWTLVTPTGHVAAPDLSPHSGYDAMRVPLFLLWSGLTASPALRRYATDHEQAVQGGMIDPVVFDGISGAVREQSPDAGYRAIPALASCALSGRPGAAIPPFTIDQPYYPATLHLMALVAQVEGYSACVPI
jgi:endoglucanase